jgi:hypothetical protein
VSRPSGSNADEWYLFLSEWLGSCATHPDGLAFVAVQIAEAIEAEREACAETAESIYPGVHNLQQSIADAIRDRCKP